MAFRVILTRNATMSTTRNAAQYTTFIPCHTHRTPSHATTTYQYISQTFSDHAYEV
jgi:hypothetical protein